MYASAFRTISSDEAMISLPALAESNSMPMGKKPSRTSASTTASRCSTRSEYVLLTITSGWSDVLLRFVIGEIRTKPQKSPKVAVDDYTTRRQQRASIILHQQRPTAAISGASLSRRGGRCDAA